MALPASAWGQGGPGVCLDIQCWPLAPSCRQGRKDQDGAHMAINRAMLWTVPARQNVKRLGTAGE